MTTEFVKAGKNPVHWEGCEFPETAVSGAWVCTRIARKEWRCQFAGTHQSVPFFTVGRTAGRALRAMRRALERERIPAVTY